MGKWEIKIIFTTANRRAKQTKNLNRLGQVVYLYGSSAFIFDAVTSFRGHLVQSDI